MRKIITTTFVTMDGVMQAPGGPGEDTRNGFKWGGWTFNYWDELMGNAMGEFMNEDFDLLLGRHTYDIFAAHWPHIKNDPVADKFNTTTKYVVSHSDRNLKWNKSTLITGDVPGQLKKLKSQTGNDMWVHGSGNLIQTLLKNELVDTVYLWIFPVTIGKGERLFEGGTLPKNWKLSDSKTSSTSVLIVKYEPAGELKTGSFALTEPSEEELERREKLEKLS